MAIALVVAEFKGQTIIWLTELSFAKTGRKRNQKARMISDQEVLRVNVGLYSLTLPSPFLIVLLNEGERERENEGQSSVLGRQDGKRREPSLQRSTCRGEKQSWGEGTHG